MKELKGSLVRTFQLVCGAAIVGTDERGSVSCLKNPKGAVELRDEIAFSRPDSSMDHKSEVNLSRRSSHSSAQKRFGCSTGSQIANGLGRRLELCSRVVGFRKLFRPATDR